LIIGFPERIQGNLRDYRGIMANLVYIHFVPVPNDCLENDIALGWDKIYSTRQKDIELFPKAGGMSGGPIFSYIRGSIKGPWTAEKQLVFSGILHYQHPDGCLLGHSRQLAINFINDLLYKYNDVELVKALSLGYKLKV